MDIERRNSNFIRDILVKIVLVVLFVFLLTLLFPMPNLKTFYDAVFNNNVQTMKDAAEDWFTTERMPKEVGEEETLTLQDMLDKKLILPFLDKDGKECDTENSYVTVRKDEKEYVLKVYLSCNGKSDYIIEPIGCYNFCPDGKCETPLVETNNTTGEVTVKVPTNNKITKVTNNTPNNTPNNPNPVDPPKPGDKYKLQYLYKRTITAGSWTIGEWQTSKEKETSTVKLVDKKTQYTGQKKVTKGTTLYKHIKYAYKNKWTYDTDWTDEVKSTNDDLKLYGKRTLYTGRKKIQTEETKYKHVKYAYKDNWTLGDWTTNKRNTSDTVKLADTRYTVRKTITNTNGTWSAWQKDYTWRSSRPGNTSTKQWGSAWDSNSSSSWQLVDTIKSRETLPSYSGDYKYEFLYSKAETCTSDCGGRSTIDIRYYRRYRKLTSTTYRYTYRTYSTHTSTSTDEKVVSNPSKYTSNGYKIVKTEYRYKTNKREKYLADTKWTNSKTSPSGYEYANEKTRSIVIKHENLGKWVSNTSKLGEYTEDVATRVQYKYRYNNPERYISDTIWTTSITPPSGYTYTGENKTNTKTSYADLGKWVSSKSGLGEYTHNIEKRTLYKYKYYNSTSRSESKWFDKDPGGDWVFANQTRKIKIN